VAEIIADPKARCLLKYKIIHAALVINIFIAKKAQSPISRNGARNGFASIANPDLIHARVRIASRMLRRKIQ